MKDTGILCSWLGWTWLQRAVDGVATFTCMHVGSPEAVEAIVGAAINLWEARHGRQQRRRRRRIGNHRQRRHRRLAKESIMATATDMRTAVSSVDITRVTAGSREAVQ